MAIDVRIAPYGPAAARALRDAIASHKEHDPLEPVTVVVATNYVGVTARRLLASGTLGPVAPGTSGIAGVTFLTVYRMAELLGAPALAANGRRPVSTPVLSAAIRGVLADAPGIFRPVAEHPATERALVDAYRELSQCDDAALDALTRTGRRAADVVRVARATRRLLAPEWYDERDLLDAAARVVTSGSGVVADLGAVVLHLPQSIGDPAAAFLRVVASVAPVTVIAGSTGVARADAAVRAAVAQLTDGDAEGDWSHGPVRATKVVSASDPDDEVRTVVRLVVHALRDGVALERMAVLYGSATPYARLVHEQLGAAGIPHNGAAIRTLAQSVLGSSLLALLSLPDHDFHRHDVMALLASAPVHQRDGRPVPASRWERISRRAGVVRGAERWHEQLTREVVGLEQRLAEERAATDRDPRPGWYEHELAACRDLRAFVAELAAELVPAPGASWRELAAWAQELIDQRLAGARRREAWPDAERQAADKIEAALERLAGLDGIEPAPGLDVFRRTLAAELDADLGRVGRLGDGVLMGHVGLGLGLDLDRVFVCGLAEGTFPARVHDDSLLPDADRRATGGSLPLRAGRVDDEQRLFLAALAAAPERVLVFPRGDLRRTTERVPSRFVLDTVEALSGSRPGADDLAASTAPWLTTVPSFAAGVARAEFPATAQEHRLRTLLDHARTGRPAVEADLRAHDAAFDRALECTSARAGRAFTRFDGNLGSLAVPSPARTGHVVSPTRLEAWAHSPFDYLMDQVLRVEIPELPEEVYELSPLDRGNLVHEVLDTFVGEVLGREEGAPAPGARWDTADRARLREIAAAACDRYAARGLTGRRVFWDRDRRRIVAELDRFLDEDAIVRERWGLTPIATELRFGLRGSEHPAVEVALSDGRTLRFRGAADRIDRGVDGELSVVDYKTGSPREGIGLQLHVYARAARAAYGGPDTPVSAAYWYVSTKHKFAWSELEVTPGTDAAFDRTLRAIVDGIEQGVFPCALDEPGAWTYPRRSYADPDARGTRDRWRAWARKCDAPELAGYVELVAGTREEA